MVQEQRAHWARLSTQLGLNNVISFPSLLSARKLDDLHLSLVNLNDVDHL